METLYHQDSIEIRPRGVKNGAGLLLELVNDAGYGKGWNPA